MLVKGGDVIEMIIVAGSDHIFKPDNFKDLKVSSSQMHFVIANLLFFIMQEVIELCSEFKLYYKIVTNIGGSSDPATRRTSSVHAHYDQHIWNVAQKFDFRDGGRFTLTVDY